MYNKINILVTAIGSMSSSCVVETLAEIENVKVFGCDINKKEYLVIADKFEKFFQVPKANSSNFIQEIIKLCLSNDIKIIFPLTDLEVDILTQEREIFEQHNIVIASPDTDTVRFCRNKDLFFRKLRSISEIKLIPTYHNEEILSKDPLVFPLMAKPTTGRSSEGIFKINNLEFLNFLLNNFNDYVFQDFIIGTVYTVDIARDMRNNFFALPRKEILRTSNGAGLTVEIERNEYLSEISKLICETLNIIGCINVEFIYDGKEYYLMDINPRFSAGVGFSKLAGYDFVKECFNIFTEKNIETNVTIKEGIFGKLYSDYKIS